MSLAAALNKGLETADTIGNWDPFAADAPKGPANANAVGKTVATPSPDRPTAGSSVPAAKPARPLDAVREAPKPAPAPAPVKRPVAKAAAKQEAKPAQRANWLHDAVPGGRVNAAQYVRELDRFASEETRRAVSDVVMDVNPKEVEGVVRRAARIKGRYLAKLLDLGARSKTGVQEAEIAELTRYRESYEELARGLDLLKSAIEAGDIRVSGMVKN